MGAEVMVPPAETQVVSLTVGQLQALVTSAITQSQQQWQDQFESILDSCLTKKFDQAEASVKKFMKESMDDGDDDSMETRQKQTEDLQTIKDHVMQLSMRGGMMMSDRDESLANSDALSLSLPAALTSPSPNNGANNNNNETPFATPSSTPARVSKIPPPKVIATPKQNKDASSTTTTNTTTNNANVSRPPSIINRTTSNNSETAILESIVQESCHRMETHVKALATKLEASAASTSGNTTTGGGGKAKRFQLSRSKSLDHSSNSATSWSSQNAMARMQYNQLEELLTKKLAAVEKALDHRHAELEAYMASSSDKLQNTMVETLMATSQRHSSALTKEELEAVLDAKMAEVNDEEDDESDNESGSNANARSSQPPAESTSSSGQQQQIQIALQQLVQQQQEWIQLQTDTQQLEHQVQQKLALMESGSPPPQSDAVLAKLEAMEQTIQQALSSSNNKSTIKTKAMSATPTINKKKKKKTSLKDIIEESPKPDLPMGSSTHHNAAATTGSDSVGDIDIDIDTSSSKRLKDESRKSAAAAMYMDVSVDGNAEDKETKKSKDEVAPTGSRVQSFMNTLGNWRNLNKKEEDVRDGRSVDSDEDEDVDVDGNIGDVDEIGRSTGSGGYDIPDVDIDEDDTDDDDDDEEEDDKFDDDVISDSDPEENADALAKAGSFPTAAAASKGSSNDSISVDDDDDDDDDSSTSTESTDQRISKSLERLEEKLTALQSKVEMLAENSAAANKATPATADEKTSEVAAKQMEDLQSMISNTHVALKADLQQWFLDQLDDKSQQDNSNNDSGADLNFSAARRGNSSSGNITSASANSASLASSDMKSGAAAAMMEQIRGKLESIEGLVQTQEQHRREVNMAASSSPAGTGTADNGAAMDQIRSKLDSIEELVQDQRRMAAAPVATELPLASSDMMELERKILTRVDHMDTSVQFKLDEIFAEVQQSTSVSRDLSNLSAEDQSAIVLAIQSRLHEIQAAITKQLRESIPDYGVAKSLIAENLDEMRQIVSEVAISEVELLKTQLSVAEEAEQEALHAVVVLRDQLEETKEQERRQSYAVNLQRGGNDANTNPMSNFPNFGSSFGIQRPAASRRRSTGANSQVSDLSGRSPKGLGYHHNHMDGRIPIDVSTSGKKHKSPYQKIEDWKIQVATLEDKATDLRAMYSQLRGQDANEWFANKARKSKQHSSAASDLPNLRSGGVVAPTRSSLKPSRYGSEETKEEIKEMESLGNSSGDVI